MPDVGGVLAPFGGAQDTIGVFLSPNRGLVAQVFATRYAALFDDEGAMRGAIDVNAQVLGWSDDATLISYWESGGKLVQFDQHGQSHTLDLPAEYAVYESVSVSPKGHWLAAVGTRPAPVTEKGLALLSPRDGSLLADVGATGASEVAWTGDERLAFSEGAMLQIVTPGVPGHRSVSPANVDFDCGLSSWYAPGRVLGGSDLCKPVLIDVEDGATSRPNTPFSKSLFGPTFAFSSDGRDVAVVSGDELFVGRVDDGGTFRSLGHALAPIVAVAW
jgi:hypothetical protein